MLKDVIHRELNRYEDWWISPRDLDTLAENIADAISKGPEYSISESRTHWHECWRYTSHHACAVAEVERLRAALEEILKKTTHEIIPGRPYYDDVPDGLVESDLDFVRNNLDACIAFLEEATSDNDRDVAETAARGALGEDKQ